MCKLAHIIHGFIAGLISIQSLALSAFLWMQFLVYEYVEWKIKHDKMYPELREWSIGYVIGLLISMLKNLFMS